MFKQLFDLGRQALFLLRDVEQNKQEIAKVRRELDETNSLVLQLAHELQRISEREVHERERLELRLENALLRFEKAISSAKPVKKRRK
ncbi:MAG TPA: hypothetical protein VG754_07155 [Verrucomicrobiae bacterium]|nr:hypothetical protein [Verrucomicrobiae bacterium]